MYSGDYKENEDIRGVDVPDLDVNPIQEVWEWLDGAVKVTCEIKTESNGGRNIRRVKKYWEMADGSTQITEDTVRAQRNPSSGSDE